MTSGLTDTQRAAVSEFRDQAEALAVLRREREQLTARVTARNGRVEVAVNADGVVTEVRFTGDLDALTYDELATATAAAARDAADEVARKAAALLAPLAARRAAAPQLHDLIDGLPRFEESAPDHPRRPWTVSDDD